MKLEEMQEILQNLNEVFGNVAKAEYPIKDLNQPKAGELLINSIKIS
jgi:hypothetical protein